MYWRGSRRLASRGNVNESVLNMVDCSRQLYDGGCLTFCLGVGLVLNSCMLVVVVVTNQVQHDSCTTTIDALLNHMLQLFHPCPRYYILTLLSAPHMSMLSS
jgi:hypothetical protein